MFRISILKLLLWFEGLCSLHCSCKAMRLVVLIFRHLVHSFLSTLPDWAVQLGHVEVLKIVFTVPGASVMDKNAFGKSALSMVMEGVTSEAIASVLTS